MPKARFGEIIVRGLKTDNLDSLFWNLPYRHALHLCWERAKGHLYIKDQFGLGDYYTTGMADMATVLFER